MIEDFASKRTTSKAADNEDHYRRLIYFMPTALWQVNSRAAGEAFNHLRSQGVTNASIAAYLDEHQELVEHACDTVLVTEVNQAAVTLFRGSDTTELTKPVRYLFAGRPEMAKRVMVAHFDGRRSYAEQAQFSPSTVKLGTLYLPSLIQRKMSSRKRHSLRLSTSLSGCALRPSLGKSRQTSLMLHAFRRSANWRHRSLTRCNSHLQPS